jgi:hypothetical protein
MIDRDDVFDFLNAYNWKETTMTKYNTYWDFKGLTSYGAYAAGC